MSKRNSGQDPNRPRKRKKTNTHEGNESAEESDSTESRTSSGLAPKAPTEPPGGSGVDQNAPGPSRPSHLESSDSPSQEQSQASSNPGPNPESRPDLQRRSRSTRRSSPSSQQTFQKGTSSRHELSLDTTDSSQPAGTFEPAGFSSSVPSASAAIPRFPSSSPGASLIDNVSDPTRRSESPDPLRRRAAQSPHPITAQSQSDQLERDAAVENCLQSLESQATEPSSLNQDVGQDLYVVHGDQRIIKGNVYNIQTAIFTLPKPEQEPKKSEAPNDQKDPLFKLVKDFMPEEESGAPNVPGNERRRLEPEGIVQTGAREPAEPVATCNPDENEEAAKTKKQPSRKSDVGYIGTNPRRNRTVSADPEEDEEGSHSSRTPDASKEDEEEPSRRATPEYRPTSEESNGSRTSDHSEEEKESNISRTPYSSKKDKGESNISETPDPSEEDKSSRSPPYSELEAEGESKSLRTPDPSEEDEGESQSSRSPAYSELEAEGESKSLRTPDPSEENEGESQSSRSPTYSELEAEGESKSLKTPDPSEEDEGESQSSRSPTYSELEAEGESKSSRTPDPSEEDEGESQSSKTPDPSEEDEGESQSSRTPDPSEEDEGGSNSARTSDATEEDEGGSNSARTSDATEEEDDDEEPSTGELTDDSEEQEEEEEEGTQNVGSSGPDRTVSSRDLHDVAMKAGLSHANLLRLFLELDPSIDIENAQRTMDTKDFKVQSWNVLQSWRQSNERRATTRKKILDSLQTCGFIYAKETLEDKWGFSSQGAASLVDGPHNDAAMDAKIDSIRRDLKFYYLRSLCKKQMYPWKPGRHVELKDIYVPLTVDVNIPGARQHFKKPLHPYTEFLSRSQENVRYVLSGDPGQGKSTFCAKIAYDWSEEMEAAGLDHIRLLFILELGKLDRSTNIVDAICSQLLSDGFNPSLVKSVFLDENLHNSIAVVFDGLDEAPTDLLLDGPDDAPAGNIVRLLQFKGMRKLRVLVTTRPWRESEILHSYSVYERLELRKMTKADALKLVTKFCNSNPTDPIAVSLGKSLQTRIKHNRHFVDTSTPLAVLLLCWYWCETGGKKDIPKTRHELYAAIFKIMNKEQKLQSSQEFQGLIDRLGEVGLQGLIPAKTPKIIFTEDEMLRSSCSAEDMDRAKAIGILGHRGHKRDKTIQFFHKSGQEFCCGKHLADDNHPERLPKYLTEIHTVKDALSVALVLTFAASSLNAAKLILKKLLNIFRKEIHPLMTKYLDESLPFDEDDGENLSTLTIQQILALMLECNFEAQGKKEFASIWDEIFQDGKIFLYGISSKVALSLAHCLENREPSTVRTLALRPISHPSHPFIFHGPNLQQYTSNLQLMKNFTDDEIKEYLGAFKKANQHDLHPEWADYTPAQSLANMACIAAVEHKGLACASDTNIRPLVEAFKHVHLVTLDLNNFRLDDFFKYTLVAIENGHLKAVSTLFIRGTTSTGKHMTRLMKSLPKMPLLCRLDTSLNKVEDGKSIPNHAENLSKMTAPKSSSLQSCLFMTRMNIPAEDMEVLVQNLMARLKKLNIDGNRMSDAVASHLMNNLHDTLLQLALSVKDLSQNIHNQLLQTLPTKLPHLTELRIYGSYYLIDLLREVGRALERWKALEWLTLRPNENNDDALGSDEGDCVSDFLSGLRSAKALKTLRLYGVSLGKDDFEDLLTISEEKNFKDLRYSKQSLPNGIKLDLYDEFLILE